MQRKWQVCMLAIVLPTAGCSTMTVEQFTAHVKDKPAQDFELTDLDGAKVRLSDYRGKPVLLAFWAVG